MKAAVEKSRSAKFQIFRHRSIIIYTRLPAGGTYYPICMFPTNGECLIGISDAYFAFCLRVSVILPTCSLYPHKACLLCATPAGMDLYIQLHVRRHLPRAVPWISEDRLLNNNNNKKWITKTDCFSHCQMEQTWVKSKETVGNSWTVLKVILGHEYHHNH